MNNLTKLPQNQRHGVPAVADDRFYRKAGLQKNSLEPDGFNRFAIAFDAAPDPQFRTEIAERIADLTAWLQPASQREIKSDLSAMFVTMAGRSGDETDASVLLAVYLSDLAEFPAWAVRETIADFRRGKIGDGKWYPAPGEICRECARRVAGWAREKTDLIAIADARVLPNSSSDMRGVEKIMALAASLKAEFSAARPPKEPPMQGKELARWQWENETKQDCEEKLAHTMANPLPPPTLSPYLRRQLGLPES